MSWSIALRRSPNPGAFTGGLERAADLVDDEGGEGLALEVLRHIRSGLPACMTFSSTGNMSLTAEIFWLAMRM